MLAGDGPRAGIGEGEGIVSPARLLGADACRGVGAQPQAHLAAVVERERMGGDRYHPRQRHQRGHQQACRRTWEQGAGFIRRRFVGCQGTSRCGGAGVLGSRVRRAWVAGGVQQLAYQIHNVASLDGKEPRV